MKIVTLRKKNICVFCATLAVVTLVGTFFYAHFSMQNMKCSDSESKDILNQLCMESESKTVTGSLCDSLCHNKMYTFVKCLSRKEGKQVYLLEYNSRNGEKYVLKSKRAFIQDYDPIGFRDSSSGKFIHPSNQNYQEMVWDSVGFNLHVKLKETGIDVIKRFWNGDVSDFDLTSKKRPAALDSLWSLMQQDEYALAQFAQHRANKHIPQVYGSCGHFYMLEYVLPGKILDPGFFEITQINRNLQWEDQVNIAVGILNLVGSFEEKFHEPLHICDVKGENFGVAVDEVTVKAIDTDMVMFDTKLKVQFLNTNCSKHSDCDFFDCKGWCDISKGTCTTYRINNNLQAVCEKIFISSLNNAFHGLLQNPPKKSHDTLESLLEMCARPPRDTSVLLPGCDKHECEISDSVRWTARKETMQGLYTILKASLLPI